VKKLIAFVSLVLLLGTTAFAQVFDSLDLKSLLSVGGGFRTGGDFTGEYTGQAFAGKANGNTIYDFETTSKFNAGLYTFIDLKYAEFSIDWAGAVQQTDRATKSATGDKTATTDNSVSYGEVAFTLLGKYPFEVGTLTIYPLAGVNYTLQLGDIDDSSLGFDVGAGLNVPLGGSGLFIRAEALFNIQLKSFNQVDDEDAWLSTGRNNGYTVLYANAGVALGPRVLVGVGYKF
jgi:hypothetical protein